MDYEAARVALVEDLRSEIRDERVLSAFRRVPRERFVPERLRNEAYENRPLPIGHEQTISQPLMVAVMTQALRLRGQESVLEVGTGSGYQAALLSLLARRVISVERLPALARTAADRLRQLRFDNVTVHVESGSLGWPDCAPYDAIIVTAGAPRIPSTLVAQLAPGGRLVIPVGGRRLQTLVRATRTRSGVATEEMGECRFVPLVSEAEGWPARPASNNGAAPVL